jgi:iron complex outermembrane recepter protein
MKKTYQYLANAAVALALTGPAFAQSAPVPAAEEEAQAIADIVVTAQVRNQKLQDTPLAITAGDAALFEARGQTDIAAVAAQAPNVVLRAQPQSGGIGLIARPAPHLGAERQAQLLMKTRC